VLRRGHTDGGRNARRYLSAPGLADLQQREGGVPDDTHPLGLGSDQPRPLSRYHSLPATPSDKHPPHQNSGGGKSWSIQKILTKNAPPPPLGAEGIPGAQCRPAGQPPGTAGWPQGRKGGISKHANVGQGERVETPPIKKETLWW